MSERIKYTTEAEAYNAIKNFLLSAMSDDELDKDNFEYYYPDFNHASELLEELISIDYFRGESAVEAEKLEASVLDLIQKSHSEDTDLESPANLESNEAAEDKPLIYILGILNTQGYDQDGFISEIQNTSKFCDSPNNALKSFVLDGGLGFCNASDAEHMIADIDRCSVPEPVENDCESVTGAGDNGVTESDIAEAEDLCIEDTPAEESESKQAIADMEDVSETVPDAITIKVEPVAAEGDDTTEEIDSTEAMEKLAQAVVDICGKLFAPQTDSEN